MAYTAISDRHLDDMIVKLLTVGMPNRAMTKMITQMDLIQLAIRAREVVLSQPSLLELDPPVKVCGDIHGQYGDLLRLFHQCKFPPFSNYLFLGDYVDRGRQNLETICLLLCFKIKYPNNFFLLRGNHEWNVVNHTYGFYLECYHRYSPVVWQCFNDMFNSLPMTALIGDRILCMHGGLPKDLINLNQLREIKRPFAPTQPGFHLELLWNDPMPGISGFQPSKRGAGNVFGEDALHEKCRLLDIDLVARGHQVVQDGYEFFGNRKLVTLFSAPHYCGQFNNAAAVMNVDENLQCSFTILRPAMPASLPNTPPELPNIGNLVIRKV
ncbi:Serine/threonine-protein phosphatase [Aphelenchoides besseyi]|nr:Serine/threonine-protein phosphatase [Aphelenchoides besseyi]KAI6235019.1 Serine/threonine-protein phosphatase [Aphelenchoides besseyi]